MSQRLEGPSLDDSFRSLANQDRRRILFYLLERDSQAEVSIPEVIEAGENKYENLLNAYHHNHLPLLDSFGIIEWDKEVHVVSQGPNFDDIRPLLNLIDTNELQSA